MAKKKSSLASKIVALVLVVLLVVIVLGTIFEIFIAPKGSKVEAQYEDKDNVSVSRVYKTKALAQAEAFAALGLYAIKINNYSSICCCIVPIFFFICDSNNLIYFF